MDEDADKNKDEDDDETFFRINSGDGTASMGARLRRQHGFSLIHRLGFQPCCGMFSGKLGLLHPHWRVGPCSGSRKVVASRVVWLR